MKQVRDRLSISFSGGETSAMMTKLILDRVPEQYKEVVVTFANTGQENEETLKFVNMCDKYFGFNTVWLEAEVIHEKRKGTKHKVVNFETASRNGEPFEQCIIKYGIPNHTWVNCTRELKLAAMTSYLRSIGWKKGTYDTAIGIRIDEMDRVTKAVSNNTLVYPLIEWVKADKNTVRSFWEQQPFRLNLKEHQGNCKTCWKKSLRKLLTIANENPEYFDFNLRMEELYPHNGANKEADKKRVFFRGERSTKDILALAKYPFTPFVDGYRVSLENFDPELDSAGSCSESCEIDFSEVPEEDFSDIC